MVLVIDHYVYVMINYACKIIFKYKSNLITAVQWFQPYWITTAVYDLLLCINLLTEYSTFNVANIWNAPQVWNMHGPTIPVAMCVASLDT